MKKLLLSCLFFLSFVVQSFSQSPIVVTPDFGVTVKILSNSYLITFIPSKFSVKTDSLSDYIDVKQKSPFCYLAFSEDIYDYQEDLGRPELPFYSLSLQLPDASSTAVITNVTPYISNNSYIGLPCYYLPCQNRDEDSSDNTIHFDTTYYYSGGIVPPLAELSPTYSFVGTTGVELTINPFEYLPESYKIIVPDSIQIEIEVHSNSDLLHMVSQYTGQDCSYDATMFYDTYAGIDIKNEEECLGDYIILTESGYCDTLATFVQHKTSLGYNVTMYDIETEGLNNKDDIRDFLYRLYQKEQKIRFLLLVGSLNKIPTSAGLDNIANDPPTDIYYACLESSNISNEPNLYPEIYVGRWLVNNSYDLNYIMNKTIDFENAYRYTTLCQAELFSGDSIGKSLFNRNVKWISNDVLSVMHYPSAYHLGKDSNVDASLIINTLRNDTTWLLYYRGHGSGYTMGPPYNLHVYDFDRNSYTYLGFAFACKMGDVYHVCFAKDWLCNAYKGGPIFYASTTKSKSACNNNHSKRVFKMLHNGYNMHIAQMTVGGSSKYYGSLHTSSGRRNQIKKYMLYGDPSLYILGKESSVIDKSPQRHNDSYLTNDAVVEYVFDVNGRLYGIGNGLDIIQSVPNGIYVIYNSTNNTYSKIVK